MSRVKINTNKIKPAVVASIEEGSIGEELGFEVGDQLISINGIKPRDLIDYKFLIAEENIELTILDEQGKQHIIDIEKEYDDELGLGFTPLILINWSPTSNPSSSPIEPSSIDATTAGFISFLVIFTVVIYTPKQENKFFYYLGRVKKIKVILKNHFFQYK